VTRAVVGLPNDHHTRPIMIQTLGQNSRKVAAAAAAAASGDKKLGTLRVFGRDSQGLVAACSQILGRHGANIVNSEHWTDTKRDLYFQRLAFVYDPNRVDKAACQQELDDRLSEECRDPHMGGTANATPASTIEGVPPVPPSPPSMESLWNWRDRRKRVGIMVSRYDHCLWELLLRHSSRELDMDVAVVISNHETLRPVAETFGVPYHVTGPVTPETKAGLEEEQLDLLQDVDVVVLARYMQVLSPAFLGRFPHSIINIHHSFLPAFVGGSPYHQAYDRGVKLIGATAHYATADLDDGPIIEQDVIPVSHRDGVRQLMRKGRILERNVLLKALEAHLDDRIIVHENRCIVFGD
jgi:formyltetrahydrofolate deformylase